MSTTGSRSTAQQPLPATPYYDPEVRQALALGPERSPLSSENLAQVRAVRMVEDQPLSDEVVRRDHVVPGEPGDPEVRLRVSRPKNLTGPAPCVYWIHGGGYVMGTVEQVDLRFDRWCQRFGVVGVSPDYRLAPETPYPGPLHDCYAGLRWVFENADEIGVDTSRVGIGGESAGGGLAAALALLVRDRAQFEIGYQLLIYPMIDDRRTTMTATWDVPIWDPDSNEFGWRSYLGDLFGTDDVPSHAAAARADDLQGLPPTFIMVGSLDAFCDENIDYARRLNNAGVETELHVYPGAPHGFDGFAPAASVSRQARRDTREWLARMVART